MSLLSSHLTADRLGQLADDGELSASEGELQHLGRCLRCQRKLEGHRRAAELLHRLNSSLPPPSRPRARWTSLGSGLMASAATIALLLVIVSIIPRGTGSSSNSPTPQASATSADTAHRWLPLTNTDTAWAWWSPDSQWLLVASGVTNGSPAQQSIALRDRTGRLVRLIQGESALWVDARAFVVFRGDTGLVGSINSPELTATGPHIIRGPQIFVTSALSSDHGAIAFSLSAVIDAASRFAVWTPTGTSPPTSGQPIVWSPDGRHLAVWHWASGAGRQVEGWVEVLSWPGLHSELQLKDQPTSPFGADGPLFDPTSSYLYVAGVVADISSGSIAHVSLGSEPGGVAWNDAGQLLISSLQATGGASVFNVDGRYLRTIPNTGDSMVASADGSTIFSWTASSARPIGLIRGFEMQERIAVDGPLQPPYVLPAPDGSELIAVWATDGGIEAFLLHR
jgi:hypothetical protein